MADARTDGIRRTATWLTSLVFAGTMLIAIAAGTTTGTALLRAAAAGIAVRIVSPWLLAALCSACIAPATRDAGGTR